MIITIGVIVVVVAGFFILEICWVEVQEIVLSQFGIKVVLLYGMLRGSMIFDLIKDNLK